MGKKRRNSGNDLTSKTFLGRDGEALDPRFRQLTSGFTVASFDTGASSSDEDEDVDPELGPMGGAAEEDDGEGDSTMYEDGEEGGDESDEEARRELALEMAAVRQIQADRARANGESPDEDGDEGEQGGAGFPPRRPQRELKNDRPGMASALEQLVQRAPSGKRPGFVEMMTVSGEAAVQDVVTDVHDDLQREAAFYDHALKGVKGGFAKLDALGMDYLRPEDYYAEMLKSDEHMTRVKESECRPRSEPSALRRRVVLTDRCCGQSCCLRRAGSRRRRRSGSSATTASSARRCRRSASSRRPRRRSPTSTPSSSGAPTARAAAPAARRASPARSPAATSAPPSPRPRTPSLATAG